MQKYKEINGNDYVKGSRTTINETMQSIQSMNSGTAFPTNNLFEGMKCYRTDLKKTYTLTDVANNTWVEDSHATLADEATHADSATKATNDKNGADITATYLKKAGDTATGDITAPNFKGNLSGNADTASKLSTARKINITGNATGAANFDGSSDVSISVTVNESKHAAAADIAATLQTTDGTGAIGNGKFYWVGKDSQPMWLWGSNTKPSETYVYNPSNFHVAAANNDGNGANIANTYLKRSGGTMSGALNFANNTWNLVGDDSYMGDHDISGTFCVKGANGETGIALINVNNDADCARISYGGGNINFNKTIGGNISGNAATATRATTATNADKLDGYHASDLLGKIAAANTGGIVAASLTENGYAKFANGLILQWGSKKGNARRDDFDQYNCAFPIAFSAVPTVIDGHSSDNINNITNTGFDMVITWNHTGRYIAIGI